MTTDAGEEGRIHWRKSSSGELAAVGMSVIARTHATAGERLRFRPRWDVNETYQSASSVPMT